VSAVRRRRKGWLVVIMAHEKELEMWACGTGREMIAKLATERPNVFLHIPAKHGRQLVVLREEPFVYIGHFLPSGCKPCQGDTYCRWCDKGFGRKTRVVFSMMDARTRETGIFEVSDVTGMIILREMDSFREQFGGSRGLAFVFSKENDKINGAIRCKCLMGLGGGSDLPEGPDPQHVLVKMWTSPEKFEIRDLPKETRP
jgi:hypothetical protein